MPFDEERYLREVLDPARQAGGTPPADLCRRYQITEAMSAAEVTETVRQVRQCWRRSRQMLKFRKLIDALEADHAQRYTSVFKAAADGDIDPVRAEIKQAAERDRQRLADLRRRLDDAAGKLRLLPPDVVASIGTSAGLGAPAAESLAAELGIEVREPDQLPQSPPYAAYAEIRAALDTLAQRHLAGFVFPDTPTSLRVMGDIPGILEQVAKAEDREQRKPRGPRTVSAEMIFTALRSTPDPAALLRYDIAARLRERVREHPYDDTLMRHVTDDLGLDPGEAKRLVYAIRQESGVPGGPVGRLRELVDAGKIQAAVDFVEALPAEALTGDAAELAAEVRARLAKAVRLRDAARTEADSDQAWMMLEDALRRAPDLSGAGDLLAGLAPRPPGEVRARLHGDVVAIGWQPSPSRAGDIAYEVYRNGVPFAEVTRPSASDERPPVNTPVTYAVAARRGQATSVPVTCPPLTYRPEPEDVRLTAIDGVVTGQWRAPAEVLRVVVERDGRPVRVEGSGFRDREVRNGTTYDYFVAAVYPDGRGEVTTPGLRRSVTPQAKPVPVAAFTVESGRGELLVRCTEPPSGVLEFVLLAAEPRWAYGTTVPIADVRAAGRVLPATATGDEYVLRSAGASGVLLAVTVVADSATIGAHREHVDLPAPQGVSAVRRGGTVHLGLEWPKDVPEIEVRWDRRSLIVTSAAYRSQGGIRLDIPEGEAPILELAPTTVVKGVRVRGPAVRVPLAAVVPLRYDVRREGPFWQRQLVVDLTCEQPARVTRLVLVIKAGRIQPGSPDDGRVLAEWADLSPPARLVVPMPKQPKPYWVRCFAEGPVELIDPPVRVLKVG
ncbi:fibronectin type III domain-containing protein [Nonomuraea glycinis]|uniref:hypothetical protein n=1 Tax=Nonomuraea glycinis TaxID=2047744 RepID=UPI002E0EC9C9|nr:hypothetical protein OHA68_07430 [Nonomuraea glycinis]